MKTMGLCNNVSELQGVRFLCQENGLYIISCRCGRHVYHMYPLFKQQRIEEKNILDPEAALLSYLLEIFFLVNHTASCC